MSLKYKEPKPLSLLITYFVIIIFLVYIVFIGFLYLIKLVKANIPQNMEPKYFNGDTVKFKMSDTQGMVYMSLCNSKNCVYSLRLKDGSTKHLVREFELDLVKGLRQ